MTAAPPSSWPDDRAWLRRLAAARAEHRAGGGTVLDALLRHWVGEPTALLAELEIRSGIAPVDDDLPWEPGFDRWTAEQARAHQCVLLRGPAGELVGAAADPWAPALHRLVERALGADVPLRAATGRRLQSWIDAGGKRMAAPDRDPVAVRGPIVSFVDGSILRAVAIGASDVHFECDRTGVTVKHRLDGVMQPFARMDGVSSAEAVISRIKVLAQLDITERRLPQDGRFRHLVADAPMDMRVSIMPSVHGEDAVLRLLDKAQFRGASRGISLAALGFETRCRLAIRELATEPSGMLLVTGPTGSGKTTTLYAVLSEINSGHEKIVTIEDPVEYELEGVLQIPVNERKGLTFARGLRSILRHDPDRILVGEIRDAETAEIAVQASLTGHQVFTTVHANSVTDVMGRFLHFGLDMFGFTSALNGVVVQRLLRRLCPQCRCERDVSAADVQAFARHGVAVQSLWRAVGCEACLGSGYAGRFVVAEVHRVDDGLRELVVANATLTALKRHASEAGVESLQTIGLQRAAAGQTTVEELKRVVGAL
ncbi:MAG: GspE/PulE family protein [Burkholderiaceae bacterium]